MTSWRARWRLKSSASPLFTQPFVQAQIKENIKAPSHWPLWGEFRASNAENVSIWWRHHPQECKDNKDSTHPWPTHDDVIKWKHFPRYWPFVREIHRSPVNSPHRGQWRRALMSSVICAWISDWVNNREAGYLRRHRAHYDVTVMKSIPWFQPSDWY